MNSIVIYASRSGNTRKIAETIAEGLRSQGEARVLNATEAPPTFPAGTHLVVVGGPTEGHRMTQPVALVFDRLQPGALEGMPAAAFDTRLRWPLWLSGSAGAGITQHLRRAGARVIIGEESFFVTRTGPELEPGEVDRAYAWGVRLAEKVAAMKPAPAL